MEQIFTSDRLAPTAWHIEVIKAYRAVRELGSASLELSEELVWSEPTPGDFFMLRQNNLHVRHDGNRLLVEPWHGSEHAQY